MSSNFHDLLVSRFPADRAKACFLLPGGRVLRYGELERGAARMASALRARGVGVGDRVLLRAPKSPEVVMLWLATLKAGAVLVPLNTAYTEDEVARFLADAEPALVVEDAAGFAREAEAHEPLAATEPRSADDLAALVYTSGTTGRSKGAMLSHGNLASNGLALVEAWGFTADDVLLHALPVFHVHGLFIALHCALLSGSCILWLDRFKEDAVIAALPKATVMMGVPTHYTRLLADSRFDRTVTDSVRLFVSGSAPLLPSTFSEFEGRTGKRILERYGMSEALILTTNPLVGDRLAGSVGYALPGLELRIAGGGDTGIVEVRGPGVLRGYWRRPDRHAADFTDDGFFVTGDIGRLEADGRLRLVGREKDLVISGGFNVYPKEVELVLDELPGVTESAVIGVPHPDWGEAVVAVIEGRAEEAAVIAAARARLAAFKVPKRVFATDALPRNAMGKVLKNELRERYRETFGERPRRSPQGPTT